jgi:hypothetical protein
MSGPSNEVVLRGINEKNLIIFVSQYLIQVLDPSSLRRQKVSLHPPI